MFAYLLMIVAPLQVLAIYWYHDSLLMVVGMMAAFGVLLVCVGFGLLWLHSLKSGVIGCENSLDDVEGSQASASRWSGAD